MIKKLGIKNFKSIKDLELDCKRVNVFIGEPNTGKSNILEALGLLSWCGHGYDSGKRDRSLMVSDFSSPTPATFDYGKFDGSTFGGGIRPSGLGKYVRFQYIENLFNDNRLIQPITISIEDPTQHTSINLSHEQERYKLSVSIKRNRKKDSTEPITDFDQSGNPINGQKKVPLLDFIKFYRFKDITEFSDPRSEYLMPPYGENMFSVITKHEKLKETMQNFFSDSKFKFVIKQSEKQFGFQEEEKGVVTSYPYIISSDTLRHIAYYAIAMESNTKSTLVFEEPESQAFPYYIKWFGERIALYSDNQFFIATHNPYLLTAIIEKTPFSELNICITYMKDYQTKIATLKEEQISEFMEFDPFFNARSFIPEEVVK